MIDIQPIQTHPIHPSSYHPVSGQALHYTNYEKFWKLSKQFIDLLILEEAIRVFFSGNRITNKSLETRSFQSNFH